MNKNLKILLGIILGLAFIASITLNIYTTYFNKSECPKCEMNNCNCIEYDSTEKANETNNKPNTKIEIGNPKVVAVYSISEHDYDKELHLYDNGTYSESGLATSYLGTYNINDNVLTLYSYYYTGTSSGIYINNKEKITTYYIKSDVLYDANDNIAYKKSTTQQAPTRNVFKELFEHLECVLVIDDEIVMDCYYPGSN